MLQSIICPISNEKIDSNVSRLTIFISVILVIVYIFTHQPFYLYLAALDYFIRAFLKVEYSPLRFVALSISNMLKLKPKLIDKAPKVFTSRLGIICLFTAAILFNLGLTTASIGITIMASSLFLLDALNIVCVGCLIYHNLVFPMFKNTNS